MAREKPKRKPFNPNFRGVWLPVEVLAIPELSLLEVGILGQIHALEGEVGCRASNGYFATLFHVGERSVSRALSHLADLEYIQMTGFTGRFCVFTSNLTYDLVRSKQTGHLGEACQYGAAS